MNTRSRDTFARQPPVRDGTASEDDAGAASEAARRASRPAGEARDGAAQPWIPTAADAVEMCRALADRQHKLDRAMRRIADLEDEVQRLAEAVRQERRFAYYDELTGLPNRRLLLDRFNQALARGSRRKKQLALLFIDLDAFKQVNDALGHAAGDELLRQVATRLSQRVRTSDTVCRYGGDEFVVLLAEIDSQESALAAARKIRSAIGKPYPMPTGPVKITASIGMAVYPMDGASYAELIVRSDLAMYFDKARCPPTIELGRHA